MRLCAYVNDIYTRSGQVAPDTVMALRDVSNAETGDSVSSRLSVVLNKHGKQVGVSVGDRIEFDANVSGYNGKTVITSPRAFRRLNNY